MIAAAALATSLAFAARAIEVARVVRPSWTQLEIPQDLDPGADGSYDDLRIIDDRGREIPYVVNPGGGSVARTDARLNAITRIESDSVRTTITFDLGTPNTRVSAVRFYTTRHEFSRTVTVWTSDDAQFWAYAGGGSIQRFATGSPALKVALSTGTAHYVRAEIDNGDDAPLAHLAASVYGPPATLVFVAQPRRSYVLAYADAESPPAYDLASVFEHDDPRAFVAARVTDRELPVPLGRSGAARRSWVVNAAIGFAILMLGLVTVRQVSSRSGLL